MPRVCFSCGYKWLCPLLTLQRRWSWMIGHPAGSWGEGGNRRAEGVEEVVLGQGRNKEDRVSMEGLNLWATEKGSPVAKSRDFQGEGEDAWVVERHTSDPLPPGLWTLWDPVCAGQAASYAISQNSVITTSLHHRIKHTYIKDFHLRFYLNFKKAWNLTI